MITFCVYFSQTYSLHLLRNPQYSLYTWTDLHICHTHTLDLACLKTGILMDVHNSCNANISNTLYSSISLSRVSIMAQICPFRSHPTWSSMIYQRYIDPKDSQLSPPLCFDVAICVNAVYAPVALLCLK